jgi:arginyl-tRNA synthetase
MKDSDGIIHETMSHPMNPKIKDSDKWPYFLNFVINNRFIEQSIRHMLINGPEYKADISENILVDFSSPNIAKNMHVGHLRSTIIGESLWRVFESLGHTVQRVNHIGDWGTQFGMLITHLNSTYPNYLSETPNINDLQTFYQAAKARFESDPDFQQKAREAVVNLQNHNPKEIEAWRVICKISKIQYDSIYQRLGVTINDVGESFYNDMLPELIEDLQNQKIIGKHLNIYVL